MKRRSRLKWPVGGRKAWPKMPLKRLVEALQGIANFLIWFVIFMLASSADYRGSHLAGYSLLRSAATPAQGSGRTSHRS